MAGADAPVGETGGFLLVVRFSDLDIDDEQTALALQMLAESPDCRHVTFARSTEVPGRAVLAAEFTSAAGYRRTLAPFPARMLLVGWLSRADPGGGDLSEIQATGAAGKLRTFAATVDRIEPAARRPDPVG